MATVTNECQKDSFSNVLYQRIRLSVPFIYRNSKTAAELEKLVGRMDGVRYSKANPMTGRLLILYDNNRIDEPFIKKQIYRYVTRQVFPGKVTDFKEIQSFSHNKSQIVKDIEEADESCFPAGSPARYEPPAKMLEYHSLKIDALEKTFSTNSVIGLNKAMVDSKIKEAGLNVISEDKRKGIFKRLFESLNEFSTRLLAGVGAISILLGHIADGIAILGIAAFETILSIFQQYKADKSLSSLKKMINSNTCVIRNGRQRIIDAKYLVPGDIIMVEAGQKVPADARLVSCCDLKTSEAMLTGESAPVCKNSNTLGGNTELAQRSNMIYMGTNILSGRGKAIVVATGTGTEIGKIAYMLQNIKADCAPIQNKIKNFTAKLTRISVGICFSLSALSLLRGASLVSVIIMGISFAIGAIPESLPAIVAAAMALSVQKMASKNAIVRKMPAVETLGCANVICCDKTGTLTLNEMTVKKIFVDSSTYRVTGSGYEPAGKIISESGNRARTSSLERILTAGVLCNNAKLGSCEGKWTVRGDPTEGALLTVALKNKMPYKKVIINHNRLKEIPFDSERGYMTVLVESSHGNYAYCKGSLSKILNKCTSIYDNGKERLFTSTDKTEIQHTADKMAGDALRVLAFCYKHITGDNGNMEVNYTFLGLMGMEDPPRKEIRDCIKKCNTAGIKVVMITGDNKYTAEAIGRNIGLLSDGIVVTGPELNKMSDEELFGIINEVQIFARTSPEQKYRIVKAFKRAGNVVAMTGDGVNDAPAIKEADIGIAMGANGSDVARDTADIILTDDNFASIVAAIEEGRTVNRNIKNSINYLLSGCLSEMIAIGIATLFTGISPFISMQILLINAIAETILGSSLTLEMPAANVLNSPPVPKNEALINGRVRNQIIRRGIKTGLITYLLFQGTLFMGFSLAKARTLAFSNIILVQIINVYLCKTNRKSQNKYMDTASFVCLLILSGVIYLPVLASYFSATPLRAKDLLALAGTASLTVM